MRMTPPAGQVSSGSMSDLAVVRSTGMLGSPEEFKFKRRVSFNEKIHLHKTYRASEAPTRHVHKDESFPSSEARRASTNSCSTTRPPAVVAVHADTRMVDAASSADTTTTSTLLPMRGAATADAATTQPQRHGCKDPASCALSDGKRCSMILEAEEGSTASLNPTSAPPVVTIVDTTAGDIQTSSYAVAATSEAPSSSSSSAMGASGDSTAAAEHTRTNTASPTPRMFEFAADGTPVLPPVNRSVEDIAADEPLQSPGSPAYDRRTDKISYTPEQFRYIKIELLQLRQQLFPRGNFFGDKRPSSVQYAKGANGQA